MIDKNNNGPKRYSRTYKSVHSINNNGNNTNENNNNGNNNTNGNNNNSTNNNFNNNNRTYRNNLNTGYSYTKVYIKKNDNYTLPRKASLGSSGFDLYSNEDIVVPSQKAILVNTGITMAMPKNCEMQIRSRSGLALNNTIIVLNSPATIDSDYRGEIKVILYNMSENDFKITKGDRIAQAVFATVPNIRFIEVDELHETNRGSQGFGSSGTTGESKYKNDNQENNCNDDNDDSNDRLSECSM